MNETLLRNLWPTLRPWVVELVSTTGPCSSMISTSPSMASGCINMFTRMVCSALKMSSERVMTL